jgi:hypothetical protein
MVPICLVPARGANGAESNGAGERRAPAYKEGPMLWVVLVVVLVLLRLGFARDAASVLLWPGVILLVLWLLGWVVRPGRRRWYYW